MESDERFKHLASDPRFKQLRRKQKKVQIDDRFQSMFTDEKFTLKYSRDKRGRKQKKTSGDDLKKYYELEDKPPKSKRKDKVAPVVEEEEDTHECHEDKDAAKREHKREEKEMSDEDDASAVISDEEKNSKIEDNEEEEEEVESESEVSSSSDEADTEDEGIDESDDDRINLDNIKYDWRPLDHDAETAETTTRRLAIQNLDWDRLDVKDIYTLVNSVRPPISVRIYVSEFGKERLKHERLEGPKEIIEMTKVDEIEEEYQDLKEKMKALKNPGPSSYKVNEYEDADEELDLKNDEIRERVRRYQLSKMKYYYAVAEFDSVETAELVYKELDGMEYEGSSLELDLRFIPDDIEFDPEDIYSECDKVPDLTSYQAPQFINSALQQTTVKFTWDETDVKRQEKLHKAYTKQELDKDDLDAYLASATDSDEEEEAVEGDDAVSVVTANSEARINKYKMLLKRLDDEAAKKKKIDVDIEWGNYSEDDENLRETGKSENDKDFYKNENDNDIEDEGSDDISDEEDESDDEVQGKTKRQRKLKKKKSKNKKSEKRVESSKSQDDGLDLLVMEDVDSRHDEFKFNPDDERFKAVYESGAYNIDPSHPNFKRTQAFDIMAEKKREKRQKTSVQ